MYKYVYEPAGGLLDKGFAKLAHRAGYGPDAITKRITALLLEGNFLQEALPSLLESYRISDPCLYRLLLAEEEDASESLIGLLKNVGQVVNRFSQKVGKRTASKRVLSDSRTTLMQKHFAALKLECAKLSYYLGYVLI